MNDKEKELQKIKVSKAKQKYENFINAAEVKNDFKESGIGTWLMRHSDLLLKEKRIEKGKYISCPEGTLVYCDFGMNPGAEISGWHFGITLNKDDNSYSPILTLVPLTSKNKSFYLDLSTEVYDRTIMSITEKMGEFTLKKDKLCICMRQLEDFQKLNCDPNSSESEKMECFLETSKIVFGICGIKYGDVKDSADLSSIMDASVAKFTDMMQSFADSLRELREINDKYEKYKKNTYAAIPQITTVSKLRLSARMNKFDPIATLQVSHCILQRLKNEIRIKFG